METSCINGMNIEDSFYKCAKTILYKIESGRNFSSNCIIGEIDPENTSSGIQIGQNNNLLLAQKKESKCC